MRERKLWIEYIPLKDLKHWPRNPKLHAKEDLRASIHRFGFTDPMIIDERTGKLVSGMGRLDNLIEQAENKEDLPINVLRSGEDWLVPVVRGNYFEDDAEIEAYILTANKLVEKGGWDQSLLETMLVEVEPIGFELAKQFEHDIDAAIEESGITVPLMDPSMTSTPTPEAKGSPDFESIPGELSNVWTLEENVMFSSNNEYGIPDLLPEMILSEFPQPLKTWGGRHNEADDGSYYLYVFGSTTSAGLPYERSIFGWWCHDPHIETLLNNPAYHVAKMLRAKVHAAVVPDVSMWKGNPKVLHLYAVYQAQWMGRFMQEAGIKVVPKMANMMPEIQDFALLGIPIGTPTLAAHLHTWFDDDHIPFIKSCFFDGLKLLKPRQLLVYVSTRGEEILEDIRKDLPVDNLILLPTAKRVRRAKPKAEKDPYLLELRKRGTLWDGKPKEIIIDTGGEEDESYEKP